MCAAFTSRRAFASRASCCDTLDYPAAQIEQIAAIIDGHDTRKAAHSLNDELVKDAR